jgi:hypothetical protein
MPLNIGWHSEARIATKHLPALNVPQLVSAEIQARCEIDYKTKATATSVVNNYFSRSNKILWELKSNIDPANIDIPDIVLRAEMAKQWTNLSQEVRDTRINHVRLHSAARSCEQYNAMILTAGFKPSKKAKIMGTN